MSEHNKMTMKQLRIEMNKNEPKRSATSKVVAEAICWLSEHMSDRDTAVMRYQTEVIEMNGEHWEVRTFAPILFNAISIIKDGDLVYHIPVDNDFPDRLECNNNRIKSKQPLVIECRADRNIPDAVQMTALTCWEKARENILYQWLIQYDNYQRTENAIENIMDRDLSIRDSPYTP